ncbi:hypothetical protein EO087_00115 [Dyella sp. M7H15-1]|uniref:hypothetical protein n=1 Tax=Dyella sp. M7H15-1 TaxID=2501295 RepID=UPI0010050056|nr:hypothetical protein [Dyella sp. M7H15-1]QAU22573.1 hypothetical protein EO087_00115 [Dyella sp. M7H15-1]
MTCKASFADYVQGVADTLAERYGVPRAEADRIACDLELEVIRVLVTQSQRLMRDYQEKGPVKLAKRTGEHRVTLWRKNRRAAAVMRETARK